jgi:hypothetical protein
MEIVTRPEIGFSIYCSQYTAIVTIFIFLSLPSKERGSFGCFLVKNKGWCSLVTQKTLILYQKTPKRPLFFIRKHPKDPYSLPENNKGLLGVF